MNVLHMKYAVCVAELGSLSKAADVLLVAQPNISRSIKELESTLGITIFTRTAKGMVLTAEGSEFIEYAKGILSEITRVEKIYKSGLNKKEKFTLSSVRAPYISEAFAKFAKTEDALRREFSYKETSVKEIISSVITGESNIGIIRYEIKDDEYFKQLCEEKGLNYETVAEFSSCIITSKHSHLIGKTAVEFQDIADMTEVKLLNGESERSEKNESKNMHSRAVFSDKDSAFSYLSNNNEAYTVSSPMPQDVLLRYGLAQERLKEAKRCRDVLIFRSGYRLTALDKQFITELTQQRRNCMK